MESNFKQSSYFPNCSVFFMQKTTMNNMAKIPIKTLVDKNGRKHDIFCKIKIISGETWYYLTDDNKHYLESKQIESGCEKLLFIINNNL